MSAILCIWPMLHMHFTTMPFSDNDVGSNALTFSGACSVGNLIVSFESFGLYETSARLGEEQGHGNQLFDL